MKITVNRLDIKNAIERIIAAVPRKAGIPILSHIKVVATPGGVLLLDATDLKVHAHIELRAQVETAGACAVPATKLHGIVDSADAEELSIALADNMTMEIIGSTRNYTVACLDADDFPVFPGKAEVTLRLPRGILPDYIAAVGHASGSNETKPHLCGIHIISEGSHLTAAATDGHRLAIASREIPDIDREISQGITMPSQACKLISGVNSAIDYRPSADGNALHLDGGGLGLSIRLLEGEYPAFRRVIPGYLDNAFTVSSSDLIAAIEACGVMIEGESKSIRLVMADETLTVSALSPLGVASATIPALGDTGMDLSVNSRFLLQAIKSLGGEIFVKYKDGLSPLMMIPVDHGPWDERIEILMPLRDGSTTAVSAPDPPRSPAKEPVSSFNTYMLQGFSRDEAKLLFYGFTLLRYDRQEKAIYLAEPDNGQSYWAHLVTSPFATYAAAEKELKNLLSMLGYIEVTMDGLVLPGHKHKELSAAGFDLYRTEGTIPGCGTPRIKCFSKNWGTWQKYETAEEVHAAWDELMKNEKALEG